MSGTSALTRYSLYRKLAEFRVGFRRILANLVRNGGPITITYTLPNGEVVEVTRVIPKGLTASHVDNILVGAADEADAKLELISEKAN